MERMLKSLQLLFVWKGEVLVCLLTDYPSHCVAFTCCQPIIKRVSTSVWRLFSQGLTWKLQCPPLTYETHLELPWKLYLTKSKVLYIVNTKTPHFIRIYCVCYKERKSDTETWMLLNSNHSRLSCPSLHIWMLAFSLFFQPSGVKKCVC